MCMNDIHYMEYFRESLEAGAQLSKPQFCREGTSGEIWLSEADCRNPAVSVWLSRPAPNTHTQHYGQAGLGSGAITALLPGTRWELNHSFCLRHSKCALLTACPR